jgi:hypothetical protein
MSSSIATLAKQLLDTIELASEEELAIALDIVKRDDAPCEREIAILGGTIIATLAERIARLKHGYVPRT